MPATYNPALPTARDWVRFTINDTDTAAALLQDEEIDALLTEESSTGPGAKYYAAAAAIEVLAARHAARGAGIAEKEVDGLRLKFGLGGDATWKDVANTLRMRGSAAVNRSAPRVIRSL